MLSKRFKVADNIYPFQAVPCAICQKNQFETISKKDRYGLAMPVVICENCGLVQTNPRMTQGAFEEFYNTEYRKLYVGDAAPSEVFYARQYQRGKSIFNYLKQQQLLPSKQESPFVLEVGCGAGGILAYFKEQGFRVKGIDLGAQYINYGKEQKGLDLEIGFLKDLDLKEKPDLVIYAHVVEHLLEPNEEVQLVRSILKEDGLLYIEVPGIRNLSFNYRSNFLRYLQNAHTYHFSLESLQQLVEKNGFALIDGNQEVKSIFKKSAATNSTEGPSDYKRTMDYLKNLEQNRERLPFYPYLANKALIKEDLKIAILNMLDQLGIRKYLRKLRK